MFEHFSLRGIRAAVRALKTALAAEGKELPPIGTPAMLAGKRRNGMSAKSPFARTRGARFRGYRFRRAVGPGSYAEASPQQLMRCYVVGCRRKQKHDHNSFGPAADVAEAT